MLFCRRRLALHAATLWLLLLTAFMCGLLVPRIGAFSKIENESQVIQIIRQNPEYRLMLEYRNRWEELVDMFPNFSRRIHPGEVYRHTPLPIAEIAMYRWIHDPSSEPAWRFTLLVGRLEAVMEENRALLQGALAPVNVRRQHSQRLVTLLASQNAIANIWRHPVARERLNSASSRAMMDDYIHKTLRMQQLLDTAIRIINQHQ
ncbi:hypothetical protein BCV70DRAFT_223425 [Testicularia cyperi]|uniref:Uncharacterized protein n=1 Tax=Testicularia cyperi TaxID=1882483 RepID=A0A317XQL5_9BASI|nr:hypothetical protein BCV70DRAFT_223425 [Testicularia cyperi]